MASFPNNAVQSTVVGLQQTPANVSNSLHFPYSQLPTPRSFTRSSANAPVFAQHTCIAPGGPGLSPIYMSACFFMTQTYHWMGQDLAQWCLPGMSTTTYMTPSLFMGQNLCAECVIHMSQTLFMSTNVFMGQDACHDCGDLVVQNLSVTNAIEGPQVLISFELPEKVNNVHRIRIVRRKDFHARHPGDGTVLYDGPPVAMKFSDSDVTACECWYYTVFSERADKPCVWCANANSRAEIIPIQTGYWQQKLISLMPPMYDGIDRYRAENDDKGLPLQIGIDSVTGEVFNKNEDPFVGLGQLRRFLKIFGISLDTAKGLIDCLPNQFNVDKICCSRLPLLGKLVGVDVNTELDCFRQRQEVKQAVAIWKRKGAKPSIVSQAEVITRLDADVHETCNNVLITNAPNRTTAVFTPEASSKMGRCGDVLSYVYDASANGVFTFSNYLLCLKMPCDEGVCIDRLTIEKLFRALKTVSPICHNPRPIIDGDPCHEDAEFTELDDEQIEIETDDTAETGNSENVPLGLCWLFTNLLTSQHVTNSSKVTATLTAVCGETWEDTITVGP